MKIYIRAAAAISPQKTFEEDLFSADPVSYSGNRMQAIEPDYSKLIDAKSLRRMSRIIKMGVATASACLKEANENDPGAIITGTAYGCLEDTGIFLRQLIERNEEMPPPTAFIQSTHNTVGAQIALMLKCHHYNNTFVHRAFSFESALLDAILLLKENEANNVLVGSADELTDTSFAILNRFGSYRTGAVAGEGCAFFLLSTEHSENDHAQINAMHTFYKPKGIEEIKEQIQSFFTTNDLNINDVDLIINGRNSDATDDAIYEQLEESVFADRKFISYKNLCGEYPTAISFALWMAAKMIDKKEAKKILIYNHYQQTHHSLVLLSTCS